MTTVRCQQWLVKDIFASMADICFGTLDSMQGETSQRPYGMSPRCFSLLNWGQEFPGHTHTYPPWKPLHQARRERSYRSRAATAIKVTWHDSNVEGSLALQQLKQKWFLAQSEDNPFRKPRETAALL